MGSLLKEAIESLEANGLTPSDVKWVGSADGEYSVTWEQFTVIADEDYDSGYGGQEIAKDLVIVGRGWWIERGEYDGSEWWQYQTQPKRQKGARKFTRVQRRGHSWITLAECNGRQSENV